MQLGMIGLGRMGANMVRRLLKGGHHCVVFDRSAQAVAELEKEKAIGAGSLAEFAKRLAKPRAIWLMVPVGAVDDTIADLLPHLERGDILIDGGNSYYVDDIRRATSSSQRVSTMSMSAPAAASGVSSAAIA
jgi:6-phosphogluconate dehydrogenase